MTKKRNINVVQYFAKNLIAVAGIVLIWRGIWHILDHVDVTTEIPHIDMAGARLELREKRERERLKIVWS